MCSSDLVVSLGGGMVMVWHSLFSRRLAAAAARLREEQDLKATRATAEERIRVARVLHDVVAHSVSVMVVQDDVITLWKDYWDFATLMDAAPAAWHDRLANADLSWVYDATEDGLAP